MAKHSHMPGEGVLVFNQTLGGRKFCEGSAVVKELLDTDDYYLVEFDAEPGETYERFVE